MGKLTTTKLSLRGSLRGGCPLLYVIGMLFALLFLASCTIPNHVGLSTELGVNVTQCRTTTVVGPGSTHLRFGGWYELQEGSLTIAVLAPDGSQSFAETYDAVSQNAIDLSLARLQGEWVIEATTTPGRGSYHVGLTY